VQPLGQQWEYLQLATGQPLWMRARPWMRTTGEATRAALAKQPSGDLGCWERAKPLEACQGCALARFVAIEQRQRLLPWAADALPGGGGGMPVARLKGLPLLSTAWRKPFGAGKSKLTVSG